jgi:ligand-binding sensor domain-containing protein
VVFIESRERIWLGTEKDGVFRYNNNKWDHFTEESGLADNRILDIFKDKKGIVWITTKSGIRRMYMDK